MLEPCQLEPEVHHSLAFWNPLERNTAECGNQWILVRSFDNDLKHLMVKDTCCVPSIDGRYLALELAGKCLGQGCLQHPLQVRHPVLVADIDRHTVEVVEPLQNPLIPLNDR